MSSSSSNSYPYKHDQKLKRIVVELEEKETMNKMKHTSPQGVVSQGTFIQRPSFSLSVVPTLRETMETYPPKSDSSCDCHYCKKEFSSPHKEEREIEMLWNKMESSLSNGLSFKRSYDFHDEVKSLFSQVDLSSHSHLGSSRGILKSIRGSVNDNTHATPNQFFTQNPSYSSSFSIQGPFVGPSKYRGGGSSSNKTYPLVDGAPSKRRRTTVFPPFTPNHFLTQNTHYSSHASSNGNHINNLLGSSKFTGNCNNMRNVYSPFNGGDTRGTTNMNIASCPRYHSSLARPHPPPQTTNHYFDIFAGNIPSSSSPARPHPTPQTTSQYYDFFAGNIPSSSLASPRPPPQTTNHSYDFFAGNILSSSLARPRPPS